MNKVWQAAIPAFILPDVFITRPFATKQHRSEPDWATKNMGEMQQRVWQVYDVDEVKQRLIDVCYRFKQSIIGDAVDEWRKCHSLRVNFVWKEDILTI